ncbi:nucleotide-binding protein [Halalkalibacter alkalisediminis]|uniref:CobB/CobQ-like glutamine amidotransferase domain-containing protein n=1 Tax=Halalkalibacter alkalisediminis TaxID=935616 RepID=A0ABV6NI47_9BACI|nr:hypothetical protein [Halalkalibacter alkalisediminis]
MVGIMIQGTSSDVGKSLICTALCRALVNRGIKVAPFKSQNIPNNSYIIDEVGSDTGTPGTKVNGLGLIPVETRFKNEKCTSQSIGAFIPGDLTSLLRVKGFEIHLGLTKKLDEASSSFLKVGEREAGIFLRSGQIIGTYFQHLFHNDEWRTWWLNRLRLKRGLKKKQKKSFSEVRTRAYDELADWLEQELNVDELLQRMREWNNET